MLSKEMYLPHKLHGTDYPVSPDPHVGIAGYFSLK